MKWFRKLFRVKCARQTEPPPSKSKCDPWMRKLETKEAEKTRPTNRLVLPAPMPIPEEVYALTTIKNFRCDTLNEYVLESDWIFVSKEKLNEPRFQHRLAKTEVLTALCKKLAENSASEEKTVVVTKPPECHCNHLSSEENGKVKPPYKNPFKRLLTAIAGFWKKLCNRLRSYNLCLSKKSSVENERNSDGFTNSYLCR